VVFSGVVSGVGGIVIFIPEGDDQDETRKQEFYDGTYKYLQGIGIPSI
jgi:hypothetical protein